MRNYLLLGICILLTGSEGLDTSEDEVKQGTFPFMALVYYPYTDDTIVGNVGRFMRNAILIRPQWLVSSTLEVNGDGTFPRKTLLARAGAVAIDANMTLNEDEFEQEREIVQVVQPGHVDAEHWWYYSISLLKTLEPFHVTLQVAPTNLTDAHDFTDKTCYIVLFRNLNSSDQQILIQRPVQIQSSGNCSDYYKKDTMVCSTNDDSSCDSVSSERNSGGPLICEDRVAGLQTYLNECKEPHLYLLLAAWKDFLKCGVEEECHSDSCNQICVAFNKDPAQITYITVSPGTVAQENPPDRRNLETQSEMSPAAHEINEGSSLVTIGVLKATHEQGSTMGSVDTTVLSTETTTSEPTTTGSTASSITESTTTLTEMITRTDATTQDTTTNVEIAAPSEIISESLPVLIDHELPSEDSENNITIVEPKQFDRLRTSKSQATRNIVKVIDFLLLSTLAIFI